MKNNKKLIAWVLLIISLLFTIIATIYVKSEIDKKDAFAFKIESKEIVSKIDTRLHAHAQLLRSGAALFGATDNVSREEWRTFIKKSKVDFNLPGVQGIGYSLVIPKEELSSHIQQVRDEGFPNYKVWPKGDREFYTSIIYLEPFEGINIRAFGYDLMTEPIRKKALELSRDMDMATLTGKVLLVQETGKNVQSGTIMYVPVYKNGLPTNNIKQRRASIVGWVSSPYRMNDLISGILINWKSDDNLYKYYLHIYEGLNPSSESLLFESHKPEDQKVSKNIRFSLNIPINFNGHIWTLVFTQARGNIFVDNPGSWTVFMGGILISILLFLLTRSLISTKYKAQKIAEGLTSELKENERLLKESQEIANLGTYTVDFNAGVWYSSEILDAILGIDEKYIRSISGWAALIHPEHSKEILDYLQNTVLAKKQAFNKEYKIIRNNDKEERWVYGLGKLELDSDNNPKTLIGTISDITEQKLAEKKIQNISSRLQMATNAANIGIWDLDLISKELIWDDVMYSLYGISKETFTGAYEAWEAGLHPDDLSRGQEELEMAILGEKEFNPEFRVVWPDKSIHYIKATGFVNRDNSGKAIRMIGTNRDITDSKIAEEKLQLSQEQYSVAVEGSNDGIWDWDIVSNNVYFSPRWKNMLGYEDQEITNNFTTWEELLHPDDNKRALSIIQAYFNNEISEYDIEFRMQHKNGSYIWILARGKALRDEKGNPLRMAGSHTDITARKNAENLLIKSEMRLKDAQRIANIGSWELDALTKNVKWSDEIYRIFEIDPEKNKPSNDAFFKALHPEDFEIVNEAYVESLKTKEPYDIVHRLLFPDGRIKFVHEFWENMYSEDEEIIRSIGTIQDITENKIAEEKLKESENRLRTIIEASPIPFVITRIDKGDVIMANESLGKLFNIKIYEAIGKKVPDFYHNKEEREILMKSIIIDGYVDNFEILLKKTGGELFWGSVSIKIMILDNEKVLIAGFHDITKRKNAEEEIIKHREHLEEMVVERTQELTISEQKLQQSIKDISDYKLALEESSIVAITDQQGVINYVNDNFCNISKYSKNELIGNTHIIINSRFHPKEFFIEMWKTIAKGNVWRGEIKNKCKDGSFYWVDSTIIPFLDHKGKPYQYVSVRFDITTRKTIEADLIKSREAADSANRAKSDFLANMSHEIRTPMNAIIGFSELLSKSVQDKKEQSQIESICSSSKNLLKIINDILDLSKIEAGKMDINPVPVSLYKLTSEIENIFAQKVKEKKINFYKIYENAIPKELLIDEVRLRQILFNLIGNAIKFTDKGDVTLSIGTIKNNENINLTILVKDTGIGIPIDQQELIFDPFNQQAGQSTAKYGGTGLGLSITKKLVEKMNGTISIESEVGKGSIFKIDFPNIPVSDIEVNTEENNFDISSILFKPAKILVVDDNTENRKFVIDLLEHSPLTLIEAANGEEAVEMAIKHLPELILMDIRMPVMNGYEAAIILKKDKLTKTIPIIAITASVLSSEVSEIYKKIFDEYIFKPLDIIEFFEKLKKYLTYEIIEIDNNLDGNDIDKPVFILSEEQKNKLPHFFEILELEFLPEYKKVIKNQVINDIEKFGKNLFDISEKMDYHILMNYSNDIMFFAGNFDIEKLMEALAKFPELIDNIKAEIENMNP